MAAYYNEFDPQAAAWLRELIAKDHIAPGLVDERSIEDVKPDDLKEFTQCHFFAGIGVWSYALRRAGWDDSRPVWTASCPCQPFSAAGAGAGFADPRHLYPSLGWLIAECKPSIVLGEQVAGKAVYPWIDLVHAHLESLGYAFGAVPFPSAGVGAPHIRDRLFWVADADSHGLDQGGRGITETWCDGFERNSAASSMGNADRKGLEIGGDRPYQESCQEVREAAQRSSGLSGLSNQPGPVNGIWAGADWIYCRDKKWRAIKPGLEPMVNGASARVVRLRGYGNAINAEAAKIFIEAVMGV